MKVLIVGQPGYFVKPLIQRLYREKADVYLLSANLPEGWKSGKEIHEKYIFPLDSQSVSYVVGDVKPDTIIFVGAADSGYSWKNPVMDTVAMTAALSNVLLCAKTAGVEKVFYLSSEEVFDCAGLQEAKEQPSVPSVSQKGMAFSQCESICHNFGASGQMKTYILRISGLYGEPTYPGERSGRVSQVLREEDTSENTQGYFPTFTSDAVEVLYRLLEYSDLEEGIYHLTGSELTCDQAVEAISHGEKAFKKPDSATYLQMERLQKATVFHQKISLKEGISRVKNAITQVDVKREEKKRERISPVWKVLRPLLETILFLIVPIALTMLTSYAPVLAGLDFFLIYVLIVAVAFGKGHTVLAVFLSIGYFIWGQVGGYRDLLSLLLSGETVCRLLTLFAAGMITAHCRDRLKWQRDDMADEKSQLAFELATTKTMNDSNVRIKKHLEEQLVNMDDSLGKIYSIVSQLDAVQPDKVMYNAVDIIRQIMHAKDAAIYSLSNAWYGRLMAYSGENENPLEKSMKLENYAEMMETLQSGQVFVNRGLQPKLPLMAAPVFANGQLKDILMVWNVQFDRLTPYHINLLMVLSNMISSSLERAENFAVVVQNQKYIQGTEIMTQESFQEVLTMVQDAVNKHLAGWIAIELTNNSEDVQHISGQISNLLRANDYIGIAPNGKIWALLANSDRTGAEIVLGRMNKIGIQGRMVENLV